LASSSLKFSNCISLSFNSLVANLKQMHKPISEHEQVWSPQSADVLHAICVKRLLFNTSGGIASTSTAIIFKHLTLCLKLLNTLTCDCFRRLLRWNINLQRDSKQTKNEELKILPERDTTSSIITIMKLNFTLQIFVILFFVFELFWMVWCDG